MFRRLQEAAAEVDAGGQTVNNMGSCIQHTHKSDSLTLSVPFSMSQPHWQRRPGCGCICVYGLG